MIPVVDRNVREISVGLIDPPDIPMRDSLDEEAFADLCESIRQNGVQVALIVEQRGDRYKVWAGHRRYLAGKRVGAVTLPCDVRQPNELQAELVKILENDDREEVNAADSALYIQRLFVEVCGNDVDEVCRITGRKRRYVEERLLLVAGDEEIFTALRARQINKSVALELNQIKNLGYRRLHLDSAVKHGMTAAAAKQARQQANFATEEGARQQPAAAAGALETAAPAPAQHACYICHRTNHPERMRYVVVHEHCDLAIGERVLSGFRQSNADSGVADA